MQTEKDKCPCCPMTRSMMLAVRGDRVRCPVRTNLDFEWPVAGAEHDSEARRAALWHRTFGDEMGQQERNKRKTKQNRFGPFARPCPLSGHMASSPRASRNLYRS